MVNFLGFIAGPLRDAGYRQSLRPVGACITAFGYFTVTICEAHWEITLAQTLLTGFGAMLWDCSVSYHVALLEGDLDRVGAKNESNSGQNTQLTHYYCVF